MPNANRKPRALTLAPVKERHVANVLAVIDEYSKSGVDLHHTMESLVERINWDDVDAGALKQAVRLLVASMPAAAAAAISEHANHERRLLREHLAELECDCEGCSTATAEDRKVQYQDFRDMSASGAVGGA